MLVKMFSKVIKTDRSYAGKVLSAVVEKILLDKMINFPFSLKKEERHVDSIELFLKEVLSSSVVCDLISAIGKFPSFLRFL